MSDLIAGICAKWGDHNFEEVYYGHECSMCGLFFAHGCAPWDEPDEVDGFEDSDDD